MSPGRRRTPAPEASPRSTPRVERSGGRLEQAPEAGPHPERTKLRRPVAVFVSRFPKITETFILREIQELERRGQPVRLVPLLRHDDGVVHPEAVGWIARALYTRFLSRRILRENLRAFRERPGHYLRVLGRVIVGSVRSPAVLARTLAIFPKSVYMGRRLAREGVAHLHAHFATHPATAAWIASAFGGIPWSFTAHAHDIFLPESRPLLGEKLHRASFVRVISEYNRRFLEERFPQSRGRTVVIHMGIDPDRYGPAGPVPGRILCVASLRPYKGIATLIDACARAPLRDRDCEVLIVGDGPLRRSLEKRIRALGLTSKVRLLGARTQDEVARMLCSASVFVHPSTITRRGWMDGIPVALMEAMATGVAVVSTWVSGIPELVRDREEGILVFPDDPGGLAEALASLLDQPDVARGLAARGREKVRAEFGLGPCVESLIRVLERHEGPVDPEGARLLSPGLSTAALALDPRGAAGIRRIRESRDAFVAELAPPPDTTADDGPRGVVIKAHRRVDGAERDARERAQIEFGVLRHLHDAADNGGSPGVPRPVVHLDPHATVIMERVPGRPLDVLLREWMETGRGDPNALLPALRAAGRWLRAFQDATDEGPDRERRRAIARVVARAARDLDSVRRRLPGRLETAVGARIVHFAGGGATIACPVVGVHGDFWPGNVLADGDAVHVIDFEGFRTGLPHEDLTYFVAHLELALARPGLGDDRRPARQAFLEGYGLAPDRDAAQLELCSIAAALGLLASAPGSRVSPGALRRRRVGRSLLLDAVRLGALRGS